MLGDVWLLGGHRIICGDSTKAEDVERVLAGVKPHLMVTDPPYGVEYDANWRNVAMRADGTPSDGRAVGKVLNDGQSDWREAWALFPGDVAYVWHAGRHASSVQSSLEASKFEIRCQIIWSKGRFAIGRGDYHWQHEPCWYAVRKGKTGHWAGDRKQTTLWEISHNKSETGHSTQKPVECMKRPIENNSSPGQAVYEPFSGSGTTIIAGEMTGRHRTQPGLHRRRGSTLAGLHWPRGDARGRWPHLRATHPRADPESRVAWPDAPPSPLPTNSASRSR
jgi:DNA modification methylase